MLTLRTLAIVVTGAGVFAGLPLTDARACDDDRYRSREVGALTQETADVPIQPAPSAQPQKNRLSHKTKRNSQRAPMRRRMQSANERRHKPPPARRRANRLCRSRRLILSRRKRQKLIPRWSRRRVRMNLPMANVW